MLVHAKTSFSERLIASLRTYPQGVRFKANDMLVLVPGLVSLFLVAGYGSYYQKPWQERKPPFTTKSQILNCPRASLTSKACVRTDFEKQPNKASVAWKNSNKREKFCHLYQAACVNQGLAPKYDDCMRQTGEMYLNSRLEIDEIKRQSDSMDCRLYFLKSDCVIIHIFIFFFFFVF